MDKEMQETIEQLLDVIPNGFHRKPYKIEDYITDTGFTDYESDIKDIKLETKTASELIFKVTIKKQAVTEKWMLSKTRSGHTLVTNFYRNRQEYVAAPYDQYVDENSPHYTGKCDIKKCFNVIDIVRKIWKSSENSIY